MSQIPAYQVVAGTLDGVRHLHPTPPLPTLEAFYGEAYYESFAAADRRLNQDPDAQAEADWQRDVIHADLIAGLRQLGAGPRVLDVGAGLGELVNSLCLAGFDAVGIEPSGLAVRHATSLGRALQQMSLDQAQARLGAAAFDVVVLANVLEHLPDPMQVLGQAHALLRPGGLVVVRVPNDFSPVQEQARAAMGCDPWWIAVPDHVNYFTLEGLGHTLRAAGFETCLTTSDFPMELFLLMGEDYVRDRNIGKSCHARRRALEQAMGPDLRRRFNQALASIGMGRNAIQFARRMEPGQR